MKGAFLMAGYLLLFMCVVPAVVARFSQSPRAARIRRRPRLLVAAGMFGWSLYLLGYALGSPWLSLVGASVALVGIFGIAFLGEPPGEHPPVGS